MDDGQFEVDWQLSPNNPLIVGKMMGGKHDDVALCLGWMMGVLHTVLKYTHPTHATMCIPIMIQEQADLIGMELGYRTDFSEQQRGVVQVTFSQSLGFALCQPSED